MAGPFQNVRVLEVSRGQAARMTGMLLAGLGADVTRVSAETLIDISQESCDVSAEVLAWDRGKRLAARDELSDLARTADVVVSDVPWEEDTGLAMARIQAAAGEGLIRVWMPPHTSTGRFAGLPDDAVLRSALGGFAAHHPSLHGRPVASVVPTFTAVHAALGAAATAAALLRARMGRAGAGSAAGGDTVVVTGLHAMAACLCSMAITGLDVEEVYSSGSRIPGVPNFRAYQAADGRWLYLAALSPDLFLRALAVLDRVDVMLLPGIDGEFTNILVPATAAGVSAELEKTFASRPCAEWLADFAEARIPAAPVSTRAEWLAGPYHDGLIGFSHPVAGTVTMPALPVRLAADLPAERPVAPLAASPAPSQRGAPPEGRPLAGLRVVDFSTFLAAPFVSSLLADYGAEVVKVERPGGDPYRVFTASYAAVNQRKTIGTLDVRDAAARSAFLDLVRDADVLVDNVLASGMERLGLGDAELAEANPGLVRCSVSAFGRSGAHADLPGFDPVLQSLSGLAAAQGGADVDPANLPVTTSAPVHDVATGVLGALGVLAALYERAQEGAGGTHVTVSLAASAGFLQLAEMTMFGGSTPAATGGPDYPGPSPLRRLYQAADGWIAVAAITGEQAAALLSLTGTADPAGLTGPDGLTGALEAAFATRPVEQWLDMLAEYDVPACPVIERAKALWDPRLTAPDSGDVGLMHIIRDPHIGRLRVARAYADWADAHEDDVPLGQPPADGWLDRLTSTLDGHGALSEPFTSA